MNYQQAVDYLFSRLPMYQRIGAPALKPNLDNTYALLKALGDPHKSFKSVHIAGTNGKGSSAHALASIFQASGYKTGLYTSPHLQRFTERIKINGAEMSEDSVAQFVQNNLTSIESINPSFFEVTVSMAFDYFRNESVDIAVIEVGLGGRLDSTNVILPEVSLITMIDWDHQHILGDTLEKIAAEKAGIIKKNIPVIIGADQPGLLPVFKKKAKELTSELFQSTDITIVKQLSEDKAQTYDIEGAMSLSRLSVELKGEYFLKNLPGVLKTIQVLRAKGWEISNQHIRTGLSSVVKSTGLKGRWQILQNEPLVVADVGHNVAGVAALIKQLGACNYEHLHLIYGTVDDKEIENILALFSMDDCTFYYTQSQAPRAMPVTKLQVLAEKLERGGRGFDHVNHALAAAKKEATNQDMILICGSTFVIAEIDNL